VRRPTAWLLLIVASVFGLVLAYPYVRGGSRLEVSGGTHHLVLVTHVFTATVALVLGPLQFMPGVRAHKRIHRAVGRGYLLAGVLPSGVAAIPVAVWSGRPLTQAGLTTAAVLWLLTGGLAYRAARRRDLAAHRAWMTRNYALTFLAVTSRILVPVLLLAGAGGPGSFAARAPEMIPIGQTLGWMINLLVAEVLIRRSRTARPAGGGRRGSTAGRGR